MEGAELVWKVEVLKLEQQIGGVGAPRRGGDGVKGEELLVEGLRSGRDKRGFEGENGDTVNVVKWNCGREAEPVGLYSGDRARILEESIGPLEIKGTRANEHTKVEDEALEGDALEMREVVMNVLLKLL